MSTEDNLRKIQEEEEEIPEPQPRPEHLKSSSRAISKFAGQEIGNKSKYKLRVALQPSVMERSNHDTVQSLRDSMVASALRSIFRGELQGILDKDDELIPFTDIDDTLPSGTYTACFSTAVNDEVLSQRVFDAVERLKQARPLLSEQVSNLENRLLTTKFTHASLTQEGSTISLEETILLASAVSQQDKLHQMSDSELSKLVETTTSSETEVVEAVNHIQVSQQVHDLIKKNQLDQETLLGLHRQLMDRLLTDATAGKAGEYRKVGIAVKNSKIPRAHSQEVPEKMKALFVSISRGQRETEDITEFLARIHTEFQVIHPFRDGNGRIGRLMMNILSLQKGYPVIFYKPEHRSLFSDACEQASAGDRGLFRRMLLEAFYESLRVYESVVPNLFQ